VPRPRQRRARGFDAPSPGSPFPLRALDSGPPLAYLRPVMAKHSDPNSKLIAENRRARFDYFIEEEIEAGIMLLGSEVKSLRQGGSNIGESYASVEEGELWLINGYIAPYLQAKTWGHEERRKRKLLVSRRELARLWTATAREGMTIVPIRMYFNDRGIVKLKIGIAKGKKLSDKRETSAKRDWSREKQRLLKQNS
jgi:SsrA-binding protein